MRRIVWRRARWQRGLDWLAEQTVGPEDMVLIGDTLHDYDTAKAMGVPCTLCAIGHQSKEDLLTAGVPVVERFSQLESLLLPQNTAKIDCIVLFGAV